MRGMHIDRNPERGRWADLVRRPMQDREALRDTVVPIIRSVREGGDAALRELNLRYDHCAPDSLTVSVEEIAAGVALLSEELKRAIRQAHANISRFHAAQRVPDVRVETAPGVLCEQRNVPLTRVGIYVPGGSAPLFSTVLMLAEPARLAGCRERILCTPAGRDGRLHPAILYAVQLCGVTTLCRVGGAQAIAAMAYGTQSIPKVDKIFGPGNRYVTAAKQLVSLDGVAIDMPAGPSEVEVLADATCEAAFVAADLLSQAEHGPDSQVMLVTTDEGVLDAVVKETERQLATLERRDIAAQALEHSRAVLLPDMREAIEFTNEYAPEHLILAVEGAREVAAEVVHAGSVFIGNYSCESAGDYASGTNHTLPTMGCTKGYSSLGLHSFMRKMTVQEITPVGVRSIGHCVELMAEAEGLGGHKRAMSLRMQAVAGNETEPRTTAGEELPEELCRLVRPNILALEPYRSARDEAAGLKAEVCLDANESPYNAPYNRYPDPLQRELRRVLAGRLGVREECLFLGNGSDEAIDLVMRTFCEPGVDRVLAPEPGYGMYEVCAHINRVDYTGVPLREGFTLCAQDFLDAADARTKVIILCSPNNPTGNLMAEEQMRELLARFDGIVVVDEAYIDFAGGEGMLPQLSRWARLVVLRTFSKAWGSAGIRLGLAVAHPGIIACFNKVKYPYNVNRLTAEYAMKRLGEEASVRQQVDAILKERRRLAEQIARLQLCRRVFPSDANFLLVQVDDARRVYEGLARSGIIVRDRSSALHCENCLRITVGTPQENDRLLEVLRSLDA